MTHITYQDVTNVCRAKGYPIPEVSMIEEIIIPLYLVQQNKWKSFGDFWDYHHLCSAECLVQMLWVFRE